MARFKDLKNIFFEVILIKKANYVPLVFFVVGQLAAEFLVDLAGFLQGLCQLTVLALNLSHYLKLLNSLILVYRF